ncbi:MAG: leucine-rich repeat domain-containing protein [Ruminococcus sp.]|nr:leucine-rich repeat domain-containing protein [Ruminococcus sp.]
MNNKIRRSIAVTLTAAALCNPVSSVNVFSVTGNNPVVASADDNSVVTSGITSSYIKYDKSSEGYTLYFEPYDTYSKTIALVGCKTTKDNVSIFVPETLNGWKVVEIVNNTFKDQTRIRSVDLPKTITAIPAGAFFNCKNLIYVFFGKNNGSGPSITRIGREAFKNCESLLECNLNNATEIGSSAFDGCNSLTDIYAPKLTSISRYSFANCAKLRTVDLSGSTLTQIPNQAFKGSCSWSGYKFDIKLPSTVKTIGKEAFYNVIGLTKIDLSNVTSIGDSAFADCHYLKTVFTGDNLSSIGARAFYGCDPMTYFVCKNDNVYIGTEALGYAHQRNYTGKKTNFTLWGKTKNGNMSRYAANYGFTYKNTKDAAKDTVNKFKTDKCIWTSGNNKEMFGVYDTNANEWKHLYIDGHKPYIEKYALEKKFEGSCYGMAAVSALVYNGYLSVDQFAPGYSNISSLNSSCSNFTKSFVNSIWGATSPTADYQLSLAGSGVNFCDKDKEMLRQIEYINYGEDISVASYTPSKYVAGHAYVCLGMEYYNDADDKNNKSWQNGVMDARILLYDVNNSSFSYGGCMYIDFETGKWTWNNLTSDNQKNNKIYFGIECSPDTMLVNNTYSLKGMALVNKLISIKK